MLMSRMNSIDMKHVLPALVLVFCVGLAGCGCDEEDPTVVVVNNTSGLARVHVETSNGITFDISDIQSGVTSGEHPISPGRTNLALVGGSNPVPFYFEMQAEYCYDYKIKFTGDSVRIIPNER